MEMEMPMTAKEVAAILGCQEWEMEYLHKKRGLPRNRLGRQWVYTEADVEVMRKALELKKAWRTGFCTA